MLEGDKNLNYIGKEGKVESGVLHRGEAVFGSPGNCFWDSWDTPIRSLSIVFPPYMTRLVYIEHDGLPQHMQGSCYSH